jgi:hypothetical protein
MDDWRSVEGQSRYRAQQRAAPRVRGERGIREQRRILRELPRIENV